MADEPRFAKGDLNGVMAAHPHVADWVRDFEARYGARPMYYGELDRDAKKERPLNLIYLAKEPIFVHIYEPPADEEGVAKCCGLDWNHNSLKKKKTFAEN